MQGVWGENWKEMPRLYRALTGEHGHAQQTPRFSAPGGSRRRRTGQAEAGEWASTWGRLAITPVSLVPEWHPGPDNRPERRATSRLFPPNPQPPVAASLHQPRPVCIYAQALFVQVRIHAPIHRRDAACRATSRLFCAWSPCFPGRQHRFSPLRLRRACFHSSRSHSRDEPTPPDQDRVAPRRATLSTLTPIHPPRVRPRTPLPHPGASQDWPWPLNRPMV